MKRMLIVWLAFWLPLAATAQQLTGEEKVSLNGSWAFKTDPDNVGQEQAWFDAQYQAAGWEPMAVPGNWDTHNAYAHYAGKAWYRKEVAVPASWQGKTIRLHFEAVYHDAKVWLNGQLLGESHSGFFPFEFDVTKAIRLGARNTLVVCADNTFKRGATWNWGGIRRPVSLLVNNPLRVEQAQVLATPDLAKGTARVALKLLLRNDSPVAQTVSGSVVLKDKKGLVASGSRDRRLAFSLTLPPHSSTPHRLQTSLPKGQVHLWHFDDPYLYQMEVQLSQGGQVQHLVRDRFGIRKLEVAGLQVKLNGEEVRLAGYNWVPDDRSTGNTLPAWRYKQDIDLMKQAGANMTRLSHLPLPKEVLDYIDEKGLLLFSEIPLWGQDALVDKNNPLPKQWLRQLVNSQFNHPSVIGWCVGNEIGDLQANPGVMEYVESAIAYVKTALDDSRLVVYVSHSAANQQKDPVLYSDMILFNKYDNLGKQADKVHQQHPGKPVFYSEFGHNLTSENLSLGVIDAKGMMNDIRGRDYLVGASLWTFNDYRSAWQAHASWNTAPTGNRAWGVVNVFRQPKKAYWAFRKEFAPIRALTLRHREAPQPGQQVKSTVTISPRGRLDLPAYVLRNYKLVWQVLDARGQTAQQGFQSLPPVKPGSRPFSTSLTWQMPGREAGGLKLSLLSPTGYAVYDTLVYLHKPRAPKITQVITGESGVRVLFEKNPTAEYYVVRYGTGKLDSRSDTTTNHYVDIKKLEKGQTYQFAVAGLNALGEGEASAPVQARPDSDLLPPVLWHAEGGDSCAFIGYGYENFDYLYTVEYGPDLSDAANTKTIQVSTRGVLRIPNLQNGQTYQVRLKRTVQQYVDSEWSEILTVTPDGGQLPPAPVVQAISRQGNAALLSLEPVQKATGYRVSYGEKDAATTVILSNSLAPFILVEGLKKGSAYNFTVKAENAAGLSPAAAPAAPETTTVQK
ncbi:MAG: sugar-binding domain-containing protein [Adhaeribacter sp.]